MAVTDEAILSIKAMIISGRLKPGQRLPPEAALADQLGLSRNSLREAVRALALINVLDVRQGDGTYVTSLEPELLLDALTFVVDFHRDESVLEFLRVRRILEPSAAAMAALTIGPTERAELEANLRSSSPDAKPEDLIELDIEFHRLIGVASGPGACLPDRGIVRPDEPGQRVARSHPGRGLRTHGERASRHPRRHRRARARPGPRGHGQPRRRRRELAAPSG
jgi:DNA-binding GntR family transcriptional regulator